MCEIGPKITLVRPVVMVVHLCQYAVYTGEGVGGTLPTHIRKKKKREVKLSVKNPDAI